MNNKTILTTAVLFVTFILSAYTVQPAQRTTCKPDNLPEAARMAQQALADYARRDPAEYRNILDYYNTKILELHHSPQKLCEYYLQLAKSLTQKRDTKNLSTRKP